MPNVLAIAGTGLSWAQRSVGQRRLDLGVRHKGYFSLLVTDMAPPLHASLSMLARSMATSLGSPAGNGNSGAHLVPLLNAGRRHPGVSATFVGQRPRTAAHGHALRPEVVAA